MIFLFCKHLTTTFKAIYVKKFVDDFFRKNGLSWDMVSVIWLNAGPAMLERNSGFGALVKATAPHIIVVHCILHRRALVKKFLPPKLAKVLKIVVGCGNYARNSALKHRIFKQLCVEMGSDLEVLLYHSNIQQFSRVILGKGAESCFCHACGVIPVFARAVKFSYKLHQKFSVHSHFCAYMAYIFDALNNLDQQIQGSGVELASSKQKKTQRLFKKSYLYGNDEHFIITSQAFPSWKTV